VAQRDAAVLRLALLGDVEVRHDLQAAHNRVAEARDGRRDARLGEDAVDAVADRKLVLVRLDVDVRRAFADRLDEQVVDEADDARFLRFLGVVARDRGVELGGDFARERVERVAGDAVAGADELLEVALVGEGEFDRVPRQEPQFVERRELARIARGDPERASVEGDRHALELEDHLRGKGPQRVAVDLDPGQVDDRKVELGGERGEHRLIRDEAESPQGLVELLTRPPLFDQRVFELFVGDQAPIEEERVDAHSRSRCYRRGEAKP